MIKSQAIALRCAAAMSPNLLRRGRPKPENERLKDVYGITRRGQIGKLRQLDACVDDEARRLVLGRSR